MHSNARAHTKKGVKNWTFLSSGQLDGNRWAIKVSTAINVQNSEKNYSKFEKTVVKIRPQYEQISKIPSCDWQALKNWFFTYVSFFILAIFLIHLSQERTRAKKVNNVDMQGNFRNLFILRPYFSTVFFKNLSSYILVWASSFKKNFQTG